MDAFLDEYLACTTALATIRLLRQRRRAQERNARREYWMRPIFFRREEDGNKLLDDAMEETADHTIKSLIRMTPSEFDMLLEAVQASILRMDTYMRKAVTARERLMITLHYLATGNSYTSLQATFRVSRQLIGLIIPETCGVIIEALQNYVKLPSTAEEWRIVADEFETKWGFPHAIGALDGKHVAIRAPKGSGNEYYNYKGYHSIVLLAIVDANCNFLYIDVGGKGSISDGGIFKHSRIHNMFENHSLNVPPPSILHTPYSIEVPYMLLGDKAFAFTEYCIRPFGGYNRSGSLERSFNETHSRARMTVERSFGILSSVFRVLKCTIQLEPKEAKQVVMATVFLMNFLRLQNPSRHFLAPIDINVNSNTTSNIHAHTEMVPLRSTPLRPTAQLLDMRLHIAHVLSRNSF